LFIADTNLAVAQLKFLSSSYYLIYNLTDLNNVYNISALSFFIIYLIVIHTM